MPRKCKPNWIQSYVKFSQYQQAPTTFHVWTAMSLIASVLRRNVYLDRGYFKTFPNLYICIVGPTGITKSTATNIGVFEFLKNKKLKKAIPDLEVLIGKGTSWYIYDWFSALANKNRDCCCTIYADEMKNLMGDLNKSELVTMLTDLYTCKDETDYYTKTGGRFVFKNVCINVLLCSTPEWLVTGTSLNDIDGGFTGRFTYIYEEEDEKSIPFPEDFITKEVQKLKEDLLDIKEKKNGKMKD